VMDVDDYKEINDSFGHHTGDRALREIAAVLRNTIRPYDTCVRYAGDEFVIVLAGCDAAQAEAKRVELQSAVADLYLEARPGKRVRLAISAGAAVFPNDGRTYEDLLAVADNRMYRDKSRRKAAGAGHETERRAMLPFPEKAKEGESTSPAVASTAM